MSAHCSTHGCDLVYPEGSWPLGECRECVLEASLAEAREALEPFAAWPIRFLTEEQIAASPDGAVVLADLSAGDFKRARAVLAATEPGEPE